MEIPKSCVVGGLEHEWIMTFHSVGNFIIPTDFHSYFSIFFRGVGIGIMSLENPNDLVALGVHPRHRKWRTYNPCIYIYNILVWNMNGL